MATTGKKGGSKMIWIIGGIILIAGGVGAYFMFRKPKEGTKKKNDSITKGNERKPKDEEKDKPKDDKEKPNEDGGGNTGGNTGGGGATNTRPSELNTKAKITEFQNYVINTKKDTNILKPDGADGLYGKNTLNAWNKYGTDFKASTGTSTNVSTTVDAQLQGKIDTIRNLAFKTAPKTQLSFVPMLQKSPIFVDAWYRALLEKTETFSTQGRVYRTDTGEPILNFIPKDNYFTNDAAIIVRKTPTSATGEEVRSGKSLGKGGQVKLSNGKVFIYFSDINTMGNAYSDTKGWIQNQSALKIIQQAQFSGIIEEMEFINFDNHFDLNF